MGNLGAGELLGILVIILGIPVLCYSLGKRSGYKQGQLDMYKEIDRQRQNASK